MKKNVIVLGFASLLVSAVSFADFNTDSIDGAVSCTAAGISVTINAKRTQFTVVHDDTALAPKIYRVVGHDSDGDTQVAYIGRAGSAGSKDKAELNFDDQGDTLELNGETISVSCPQ